MIRTRHGDSHPLWFLYTKSVYMLVNSLIVRGDDLFLSLSE